MGFDFQVSFFISFGYRIFLEVWPNNRIMFTIGNAFLTAAMKCNQRPQLLSEQVLTLPLNRCWNYTSLPSYCQACPYFSCLNMLWVNMAFGKDLGKHYSNNILTSLKYRIFEYFIFQTLLYSGASSRAKKSFKTSKTKKSLNMRKVEIISFKYNTRYHKKEAFLACYLWSFSSPT